MINYPTEEEIAKAPISRLIEFVFRDIKGKSSVRINKLRDKAFESMTNRINDFTDINLELLMVTILI